MPLGLPKGIFSCQAEFAVLPFYLDRRTSLDRTVESGHIMGPPVASPFGKKCEMDDICVLFESLTASCFAALVILCLHQQMNQNITFTIIHRPRHHHNPGKALKGQCGGRDRSLPLPLRASAFALPQFPCMGEP